MATSWIKTVNFEKFQEEIMAIRPLIKKVFVYVVIVCLGVLAGAQLKGTATATAPSSDAVFSKTKKHQPVPMYPNAQWEPCVPDSVATYNTRVHVKCTVPIGGIEYFAVPTSDSKHAARMLATMLTAHAAGKPTSVLFDPADTSNLPPGCLVADCRLLLAVAIE
jgi:hypothetical protein